jgi:hypothetical protein
MFASFKRCFYRYGKIGQVAVVYANGIKLGWMLRCSSSRLCTSNSTFSPRLFASVAKVSISIGVSMAAISKIISAPNALASSTWYSSIIKSLRKMGMLFTAWRANKSLLAAHKKLGIGQYRYSRCTCSSVTGGNLLYT